MSLLGLLESENSGVPKVLEKMGVSRETVRGEIEKIRRKRNRNRKRTGRRLTRAARDESYQARYFLGSQGVVAGDRVGRRTHFFSGLVLEGGGGGGASVEQIGSDTEKLVRSLKGD